MDKRLLSIAPSPLLDAIYPHLLPSSFPSPQTTETNELDPPPSSGDDKTAGEEQMLLSQENGRQLVQALDIPELEIELERAIWQVEHAISEQKKDQLDKQKKQ